MRATMLTIITLWDAPAPGGCQVRWTQVPKLGRVSEHSFNKAIFCSSRLAKRLAGVEAMFRDSIATSLG